MCFTKTTKSLLVFLAFLKDSGSGTDLRAVTKSFVQLPCNCSVEKSEELRIDWNFNRNVSVCRHKMNYATNRSSTECKPRFTIAENFSLVIRDVQHIDSGNYTCLMIRIIPPPSVESSSNVTLHVEGLSLRQLNSSDVSCVHLRCSAEGLRSEKINFTWTRKDQVLLQSPASPETTSDLRLCKPEWMEGDAIVCQASYSGEELKASILLDFSNAGFSGGGILLLGCSAGIVLIGLILVAAFCKCRKREDANQSMIFNNKVYENFSFARTRQTVESMVRTLEGECIYEN